MMSAIPPDALAGERRRRLAHALHARAEPAVDRLRAQLDAYRARAIVLNAQMSVLESSHPDLAALRAQLAATSARLDRATRALIADNHALELGRGRVR